VPMRRILRAPSGVNSPCVPEGAGVYTKPRKRTLSASTHNSSPLIPGKVTALETGSQIGPYLIVGRLGSGGMGDVYRADGAGGGAGEGPKQKGELALPLGRQPLSFV
jgi:hypothetical protein